MNWYLGVLKKYAVFTGRARRKEFWMFVLFNIIITLVLNLIDGFLGAGFEAGGGGIISVRYALAVLLPSIGVAIRRLHDIGKSGWWLFISLIPVVGGIWLIVLYCTDGELGENQYGPNPKEKAEAYMDQGFKRDDPAIGFILFIIAAQLQILNDGFLWLDFLHAFTPTGSVAHFFYLLSAILFIGGMLIIKSLFADSAARIANIILLVPAVPYLLLTLLKIFKLDYEFLFGTAFGVCESLFFLALAVGALLYYLKTKSSVRLLLPGSFFLLFLAIAAFYTGIYSNVLGDNHYEIISTMLGVGVVISCLGIIGYSIYALAGQGENAGKAGAVIVQRTTGPEGGSYANYAQDGAFKNGRSSGKAVIGITCTTCGASLEGNEAFCPNCGTDRTGSS